MASRRHPEPTPPSRTRPPTTQEAQENELISMAYDVVKQKMQAGTATSQELVHFLKLGSSREHLEQQRLASENKLLSAKEAMLQSQERIEALYEKALDAMRGYSGNETEDVFDD